MRGARKLNKETYAKAQAIRSDRILNPPSFVVNRDETEEKPGEDHIKTLTWLQWANDCIEYGIQEGNVKKQIDHKKAVCKRIREYLALIKNRTSFSKI